MPLDDLDDFEEEGDGHPRAITALRRDPSPFKRVIHVFSEAGYELTVRADFRDKRLKAGKVITDRDLHELSAAARDWATEAKARAAARSAEVRAKARPDGVITELREKGRHVFVYLDEVYSLAVTPEIAAARGLSAGQRLSAADVADLRGDLDAAKVGEKIDLLLRYRARTEAEVRSRVGAGADPAALDAAISARRGPGRIMDDESFARAFARERGAAAGKGFRAVAPELRHLGVSAEAISAAEEGYDGDGAIAVAARRAARGLDLSDRKSRDRFTSRLASRGFNWGQISDALREMTTVAEDGEE
jgi:regulatory protein